MNRVSVIVPNFNRELLLGDTIRNLVSQSLPPYEIILVDDGSTDRSVEVARSFGHKIKIIQQRNQGPGAARNAGLQEATGEFIQFQDSDDLFTLNKLEKQAEHLQQTGADIALGPWAHVLIKSNTVSFEDRVLQQHMPPGIPDLKSSLMRGWFTIFQSLLIRRSFLENERYRTDVSYGEDMEFLFRLSVKGPKVVHTADVLTLYRVDSANKLSNDAGLSQSRRVIHWAVCLQQMMGHQNVGGRKPDFLTRSFFLAGVRKHLRYLMAAPGASPDLIKELSDHIGKMPFLWLVANEQWLRLAERVRLLSKGTRCQTSLCATPPSPVQLMQIRKLGFEVIYGQS